MRAIPLVIGAWTLLLPCGLAAQTQGTVTLDFTTVRTFEDYDPRHVLAVWVDDSKGAFVRTVARWGERRQQYLYTWQREASGNVLDAVTGATLSTHVPHTVTWDCRDDAGALVPDGKYRVRVEYTTKHAQGPITPATYLEFTKGQEPVTLAPADLQYFTAISLSYRPDVETHVLIAARSAWKYSDAGTDLHATDWKLVSYDDSTWKQGSGPLGYGDSPTTPLSYGPDAANKHPCYYFRRRFTAGFAPTSLKLRVLRDDGVVVYLNGVEVARSNLDGNPTRYADLATATVGGTEETTYLEFYPAPGLLAAGENVVAAEVHQASVDSSDLGFDLELKSSPPPDGPVTFVRSDADGNGAPELTDAVFSLQYLFLSGPAPGCLAAADSNDDGEVDVSDAVATLLSLFGGNPPPPPPGPACGTDPTPDALGCAIQPSCP